MTGSTPDQEIINKVAKSLHSLVSKSKNKNKGLEWILEREKGYLEGVSFEVAESSEKRKGGEKKEASLDLGAKKSQKRKQFDEAGEKTKSMRVNPPWTVDRGFH